MAGYEDTKQKIISTLMGRPVGTEIQPENHQDYALNMLDYIRGLELIATSTLIGVAESNTTPVQPNSSRVCYIAGVAQNQTVVFENFIDVNGNPISVTTGDMEGVFIILLWNTQYWSAQTFSTNIISQSESATFYYSYNIRKTYESVALMNADVASPIGTDGKYIKIGELVTVVNSTTPAENGYYSYEGSENGWLLQSGFNFEVVQTTGTDVNRPMSQKAVTDEIVQLAGSLKNYPIKEDGLKVQSANAPSASQMRNFFIDLHLEGNYNPALTYSFGVIQRGGAGWTLRLISSGGRPLPTVDVCQFNVTANPEQGDKVTFHQLTEMNASGITGTVAVNWSKLTVGLYYSMYDYNGYGLDPKVWDKSNAVLINQNELPIASEIITTNQVVVENIVQREANLSISNLRVNPISYKHERGDAEYVSDGQLTGIDAAAVILAPQGKKTLVKAVDAKIFGDSAFSGSMAIYKGTVSSVNPTNHTLVESQDIAVGKLNTDPNAFQRMVLTNDLILQANEYLFFYVFKTTGALTMRRWTTDGGEPPLRPTVRFLLGSTWSAGSPGFYAVPLLIYSDVNYPSILSAKVDALTTAVALKSDDEFVTISLPDTIYAVANDPIPLQLYFRGMIPFVNPYDYDIVVTCAKGNQYKRYFEYLPVSDDVGTTTFTVTVKNNNGKILGTKTCNLVTKAAGSSPASLKSILTVGDSLTSSGVWVKEAQRRLTGTGGSPAGRGLTNIAFKGRKNDGGSVGWEGTGGWNWYNYTIQGGLAYVFTVSGITSVPAFGSIYTNNGQTFTVQETNITAGSGTIRCTATGAPEASGTLTRTSGYEDATIAFSNSQVESLNPFWNGSGLDFNNYVTNYMAGSVDVIYFLLSWNGLIPNRTDFASMITTAKILIDHIHTVKPAVKIKIMGIQLPSLNGGMGYAYGANGGYADTFGMVKSVLNLNKAYQDWCNEAAYSDFMEFVNVSAQFDSENNMPETDKAVNTRSAKTEKIGTNGVHPATEGYYQIADAVYRNFVANFCQ